MSSPIRLFTCPLQPKYAAFVSFIQSQLMMEAVSAVHEKEKQLTGGNQSPEQEIQIPDIVNEVQYQLHKSKENNINQLTVDEIEKLYAAAANENFIMPFHLEPFYML